MQDVLAIEHRCCGIKGQGQRGGEQNAQRSKEDAKAHDSEDSEHDGQGSQVLLNHRSDQIGLQLRNGDVKREREQKGLGAARRAHDQGGHG